MEIANLVAAAGVCLGVASTALAQAPAAEKVQGYYEGKCKDSHGERQIEARLVAIGNDNYKLLIRQMTADGKVSKAEMAGKVDTNVVRFSAKVDDVEWAGVFSDNRVDGTVGAGGKFEIKRVVRESSTMGAKPLAGAVVLLDGKNFDEVTCKPEREGKEQEWRIVEPGAIHVPKGGLYSKQAFEGSFNLHVEFRNPLMPGNDGQGRGNSGVFFPNGDEIQVLDSFGMGTYQGGGCGGIYQYKNPDVFDDFALASAPPLQWQTYDIEYRVEMKDGKPAGQPKISVLHNGIKIHDKFELRNPARSGLFQFQDHSDPVCYRNIWVQPVVVVPDPK